MRERVSGESTKMSTENPKIFEIMEYVQSANLKGSVTVVGENEFLWDLGGVFLRFSVDDRETTIGYSHHKNKFTEIAHFHENTCDVIDFIRDVNREDARVHIAAFLFGGYLEIEQKSAEKKKSRFVRHYYSEV